MVEKQAKALARNKNRKQGKKPPLDHSPEPSAVDRPGFDVGGSTGKTRAGTGIGVGSDAAEDAQDQRLPGRRGAGQNSKISRKS